MMVMFASLFLFFLPYSVMGIENEQLFVNILYIATHGVLEILPLDFLPRLREDEDVSDNCQKNTKGTALSKSLTWNKSFSEMIISQDETLNVTRNFMN